MTTRVDMLPGPQAQALPVSGNDDIRLRWTETGITPGCGIEFMRTAPLGDPIDAAQRGYRLSLRRSEAARVETQPIGT